MYVSFVAGAWKALLDSNWFNEIKTVKIWSDGGPKHFKISANMKLLLTIQHVTPSVDWWYNFFGAYHGCSVCDGVAAQAKASLINSMRDNQMAIRTSNQAIETIGGLKNHSANNIQIPSTDFSTNTFHGITQYFKFKPHKTRNILYAYKTSEDETPIKRYLPHEIVDFEDIK